LYRGIIESKKGYQCRTNTVKDRKGDFVSDADSILAGGGTTSELLKVHGIGDFRKPEIQATKPLVA